MEQAILAIEEPEWLDRETIRRRRGGNVLHEPIFVNEEGALADMVAELCCEEVIAYDTETSGLNPALGARIAGHCFSKRISDSHIRSWYVAVRHVGLHNEIYQQLVPEVAAEAVQEVLCYAGGEVRTHHGKFDRRMARADEIEWTRPMLDVSIEANAYNENERSFALKSLCGQYVTKSAKDDQDKLAEWMRKDARKLKLSYKKRGKHTPDVPSYLERFGYARSPMHMCGQYGCKDTALTILLGDFYANVRTQYPALWVREHKIGHLLHEMEWHGLPANVDCIRDTTTRTERAHAHWLKKCREMTGDAEFVASDAEVAALFYETLDMEVPRYTDGGKSKKKAPSVDKIARKLLQKNYPEHAELIDAINHVQVTSKAHQTYGLGFLKHYSHDTGCLHPSYNQMERKDKGGVPVTGRLSSAEPNAQNVTSSTIHMWDCLCMACATERGIAIDRASEKPSTFSIRRYFTVPEGYIRAYIDFSQIELRVLAWFCQDPVMLRAYLEDRDIHQAVADELGIPRKIAKQVNFGNSYGMTEKGLSLRMPGYYDDPEGTEEMAKKVLADYFKRFARIKEFERDFAAIAKRNGCMFVNPFGRPRRLPDLKAFEGWKRKRAQRQMMSSIISGTAADLMKESMIRCDDTLRRRPGRMVQTIHDELVFDLPLSSDWAGTIVELKRQMEDWPMFSHPTDGKQGVPIKVSTELSMTTWEDKREVNVFGDGTFAWAA